MMVILCMPISGIYIALICLGHTDALLRTLVIGKLGVYGDQETQEKAKSRFEKHLSKTELIPADLRGPIYRTVVSCGDENTYDTFIKVRTRFN